MTRQLVLDDESIESAQLLVVLWGGKDKVEPYVVEIANGKPGDVVEVPSPIWEHTA